MNIVEEYHAVVQYFEPDPTRRERIGILLLNFQHAVNAYPQHFLKQTYFHYMPLIKRVMHIRPDIVTHLGWLLRYAGPILPKRREVTEIIFGVKIEVRLTS